MYRYYLNLMLKHRLCIKHTNTHRPTKFTDVHGSQERVIFSELTKLINKPFYRSKPSPTDDKEIKNKRRLYLRMSFSQRTISSLSLFITLPQDVEGSGSTTE